MRKIVTTIGIAMLVLGIFAISENFGLNSSVLAANDGMIDLSAIPYQEFKPVQLRGDWDFFPHEVPDPLTSAEASEIMYVPSNWAKTSTSMESFGYAAYRLRVRLPQPGYYSLLLDNVYTSYRIYINGSMMAEVGTFGMEKETAAPRFSDTLITFHSEDGTADIVLHVSNFFHPTGGIGVAPILGKPDDVFRLVTVTHGISLLLIGLFCCSALFILYYYHTSNKDRGILFFAAFCMLMAVRIAASTTILSLFFPQIPTFVVSKLEYVTVPLAVAAFLFYSRELFPGVLPPVLHRAISAISVIYSVVVLSTPVSVYNPLLFPYVCVFSSVMAYWLISMTVAHFKRHQVSGIIYFGGIVLVVSVANQLIHYFHNIANSFTTQMAAMGIAFFIITHFHEFSLKFLNALEVSQQTSRDLEEKVEIRTRELHGLNEKLQLLATRDELTGLWNRNQLYRKISEETFQYNHGDSMMLQPFTVVYIDLDNFKYFNDTFSHAAGDLVLGLFAKFLVKSCRDTDTMFRLGGDEFVGFLPGTGRENAEFFARQLFLQMDGFNASLKVALEKQLGTPATIHDGMRFSCSLGIAVHTKGMVNVERLIQLADRALMQAKTEGKNRYILSMDTLSQDAVPPRNPKVDEKNPHL